MAKIIAVLGAKGGTGKTTISHMLGHGFGLLDTNCIVLLTDQRRRLMPSKNRRYLPFDARNPNNYDGIKEMLDAMIDTVAVVDGGGNRPDVDAIFNQEADLTLLPFRDGLEDIDTVRQDLERLEGSYAIPSQWPTAKWRRETVEERVDQYLADFKDRILAPISFMPALDLLLVPDLRDSLPTKLNNACRAVVDPLFEMEWSRGLPASRVV